MSREELIKYYEKRLETAKAMYKNDWRKKPYIDRAEKDLEEVKNGRNW